MYLEDLENTIFHLREWDVFKQVYIYFLSCCVGFVEEVKIKSTTTFFVPADANLECLYRTSLYHCGNETAAQYRSNLRHQGILVQINSDVVFPYTTFSKGLRLKLVLYFLQKLQKTVKYLFE